MNTSTLNERSAERRHNLIKNHFKPIWQDFRNNVVRVIAKNNGPIMANIVWFSGFENKGNICPI